MVYPGGSEFAPHPFDLPDVSLHALRANLRFDILPERVHRRASQHPLPGEQPECFAESDELLRRGRDYFVVMS